MKDIKTIIIVILGVALVGAGAYFLRQNQTDNKVVTTVQNTSTNSVSTTTQNGTSSVPVASVDGTKTVIGKSVEGRSITAYHYGDGDTELLFVGGIHGGYEWNTVLVAYEIMNYLDKNPDIIPENVQITVIPALNPDGLNKVVGTDGMFTQADVPTKSDETIAGRFNAHNVDLNRNFDCDWQATGKWQNTDVSGGSKAFSEPESQAIKAYVEEHDFDGVVVWYSAAGGVFSSNCHNEVLAETKTLTNLYAKASGYTAYESFDFYATTGDMVNWLAKKKIPAISVLLTTHEDTEWSKNKAGVDAILKYYAK
jgi:hypothetical protein